MPRRHEKPERLPPGFQARDDHDATSQS
jgi:hypothetical protein